MCLVLENQIDCVSLKWVPSSEWTLDGFDPASECFHWAAVCMCPVQVYAS